MNCEIVLEEMKLKELKLNSLFKLLFLFLFVVFWLIEDVWNYCIRMSVKCGLEKFVFVKFFIVFVLYVFWMMILVRIKCDGLDRYVLF